VKNRKGERKVKEYSMTPQEAEAVRLGLANLQTQIKDIKSEREGYSGHAKARFTRMITPLQKQADEYKARLRDAPPEPVSPEEALKKIREPILGIKVAFEKDKATFVEKFQNNPVHAIKWYTKDVVYAQTRYDVFRHVIELVEKGAGFEQVVAAYNHATETAIRDFHMKAGHMMNSTSMTANAIGIWKVETLANISRDTNLGMSALNWRIERLSEQVAVWKELQTG